MCCITVLLASTWRKTVTVFFMEIYVKSYNSIFPNLGIVSLDSSLNLLNSLVLLKSAMTDSVRYSVLRAHQFSDLGHSSLILKYCILWSSLNTGSILKRSPSAHDCSLLDCFPCSTCQASQRTIFGAGLGNPLDTIFCLLEGIPLFQCSRLALNRKR